MKINGTGDINISNNLLEKGISRQTYAPPLIKAANPNKVTPSDRLSVSLEGKQSYKDILQKKGDNFDRLMLQGNELGSDIPKILMDYDFTINLNSVQSLEENSNGLLKKYAEAYDEIVQGYESGQRENYVLVSVSESRYRKVTMSEELDLLDKAFKKAADLIESIEENRYEDAEVYESIAKCLEKTYGKQSEKVLKVREAALRAKNAVIPENISQTMVAATKKFTEQYSKQKNINLEIILKNITIFSD